MTHVQRSALVPYSSAQMYALINDIETYPQFLPWCRSASIHAYGDDQITASIELHKSGITKSFKTRNTLLVDQRIDMQLIDGPFKTLEGSWEFTQLGDTGCKVILDIRFVLDNRIMSFAFGAVFEEICNSLVDSFSNRARSVYGSSK